MLNQIVLVGRLKEIIEAPLHEAGKIEVKIILEVSKNLEANVSTNKDSDLIECILRDKIATGVTGNISIGDLVGIKGRLKSESIEFGGQNYYLSKVVVEKVTYLGAKKPSEDL